MAETERDEDVARAYRALGGEGPPRALDEAILARARRRAPRWGVPLSIAAVLVLAVGVVLRVQQERPQAESVALAPQVMETPRPAPQPDAPAEAASKPATAAASAPKGVGAEARLGDMASNRDSAAAADSVGKRATAPAPAAAGVAAQARMRSEAVAKPGEPLTPEAWLERIAELRKQGRTREAEESLAEFRKRYPDYRIPETAR